MRKFLKVLPFKKVFVFLFVFLYTLLPSLQAFGVVLEDYALDDVSTEVDVSEDILEEGISDPEEIAKGTWVTSEESATTSSPVVLGEVYEYPNDSDVTVVFSSLPEVSSTLTIKTVYLTDEQVEATNAVSNVAYDITTDMVDGSFNYDLTLPKVGDSNKVVYAEDVSELENAKDISNVIEDESSLKIEGLDHFTTFVVVSTIPAGITEGTTEVNDSCTEVAIGSGIKCYDTIQKAINNASDGETINVKPGTYGGFSVVGKSNLTISGSGSDTVIRPTSLITTNIAHKSTPNMKVSVLVNNSTGITIENMTIKDNGSTPGNGGPDAIVFWNASSGTIKNTNITGTYTISGSQTGQGIALDASGNQNANLTVENVSISGFQKNGIDAVNGNGATSNSTGTINLSVIGGSITGVGATSTIAQNGIVVWNRGGGEVTGTVDSALIQNFEYTPSGESASGILAYGGGEITTVKNSSFSNCDYYLATAAGSPSMDATVNNSFDDVVPGDATIDQLEAIQDRLLDKLDKGSSTSDNSIFILPNTAIATPNNRGIQAAIDAVSDGGTVYVAEGTYKENVVVNKNITLLGAMANVDPTTESSRTDETGESIIDASGSGDGIIVNGSGVSATVNGFTVKNTGDNKAGLIAGAFDTTNYGTVPTSASFIYNIVKGGDYKNGIAIENGATGEIRYNRVNGAEIFDGTWSGSGILVAGSNSVEVSNNLVENSELGIAVAGYEDWHTTPATENTITNNTLNNNYTGISVEALAIDTIVSGNNITTTEDIETTGISVASYNLGWEKSIPTGTIIEFNTLLGQEEDLLTTVYGEPSDTIVGPYVDATNGNIWDVDSLIDFNEIESRITHSCETSPYFHGTCNENDLEENYGFVKYAVYDSTRPTIEILSPGANTVHNGTFDIEVKAVDSDSGIGQFVVNLYKTGQSGVVKSCINTNGNGETEYTVICSIDTTKYGDGEYYIKTNARNIFGVLSTTLDRYYIFDNTKPTGTIITPSDGSYVNGVITISGSVNDATSGIDRVEVRLRNYPDNTYRTSWLTASLDSSNNYTVDFDTTLIPDDTYDVAVVAYDSAGNNKWLWPRPVIIVDNTAPVAPEITFPNAESYFNIK